MPGERRLAIIVWLELLALFGGIPLLIWQCDFPMLESIGFGVAYAAWQLHRDKAFEWKSLWDLPEPAVRKAFFKGLAIRVMAAGIIFIMWIAWMDPGMFFNFPRQRPVLFAIVSVGYPVLSVTFQEVLFRVYFLRRYQRIFERPMTLIVMNGIIFGWAHIFFTSNWALFYSTIGGAVLMYQYYRYRCFAFIWLEHSLYGLMIFTLGGGMYFYYPRG